MTSSPAACAKPLLIALVIKGTDNYWRGVIRGVAQFAQGRPGWRLRLFDPQYKVHRAIRRMRPDAVIAAVDHLRLAKSLLSLGRPVVNVSYLEHRGLTKVGNDDRAIGRAGAEHLLRCGFRHFSFVAAPGLALSERRRQGFEEAVREAGCRYIPCPADLRSAYDPGESSDGLMAFLRELPTASAVMVCDDLLALRITELCAALGRTIPDDIAVLGVNNDDVWCRLSRPELSSIELAVERIGWEAAARVEALISGREKPGKTIALPPLGVVRRRSTDVLAVDDEVVRAAVGFIRANAHRPLGVEDILGEVPVSRSSLQRRFRRALRYGPYHEICLAHLELAKKLLATQDAPLKAIAKASGIVRLQQLSELFRRYVGVTPGEFRRHTRVQQEAMPMREHA